MPSEPPTAFLSDTVFDARDGIPEDGIPEDGIPEDTIPEKGYFDEDSWKLPEDKEKFWTEEGEDWKKGSTADEDQNNSPLDEDDQQTV